MRVIHPKKEKKEKNMERDYYIIKTIIIIRQLESDEKGGIITSHVVMANGWTNAWLSLL